MATGFAEAVIFDTGENFGAGNINANAGTAISVLHQLPPADLDGKTVDWLIEHSIEAEWEFLRATYTSATTTINRTSGTVIRSSNAGNLVDFTTGTKRVTAVIGAQFLDDVALRIGEEAAIADPATPVSWVAANGLRVRYTGLTADKTINADLTGVSDGTEGYFVIGQDATGGRAVTWGTGFANQIPIDQAPNAETRVRFAVSNGAVHLTLDLERAIGSKVIQEGTDFTAGGTYSLDPRDLRDRVVIVEGAGGGALTANMVVSLAPTDGGWTGQEDVAQGYVRKGDSSSFTVTINGYDGDGLGAVVLAEQNTVASWLLTHDGAGPVPTSAGAFLRLFRSREASGVTAIGAEQVVTVGDGTLIQSGTHGGLTISGSELRTRKVRVRHATDPTQPVTITIADNLTQRVVLQQALDQTGLVTVQRQTSGTFNEGQLISFELTGPGAMVNVQPSGATNRFNAVGAIRNAQKTFGAVVETVASASVSGAVTRDASAATTHDLTLTGDVTSLTFNNTPNDAAESQSVVVIFRQDATGGRAAAHPTGVIWPGGTAPTLDTTANARNMVAYTFFGGGEVWGFPNGIGQA